MEVDVFNYKGSSTNHDKERFNHFANKKKEEFKREKNYKEQLKNQNFISVANT